MTFILLYRFLPLLVLSCGLIARPSQAQDSLRTATESPTPPTPQRRKTIPYTKIDSAGVLLNVKDRFKYQEEKQAAPRATSADLSGTLLNLSNRTATRVVSTSDTLLWESDSTYTLYLIKFKENGRPASPAMSERNYVNAYLIPEWTKEITTNAPIVLNRSGNYFFQADTSGTEGVGVVSTKGGFPKLKQISQVIDPMIYINTKSERNTLINAVDKRRAFENFWLTVAGSNNQARALIREYFQRVSHANQFYTSHKLGWKTDRGIVYIIFGPPSEIQRAGNKLTWVYFDRQGSPAVSFDFTQKTDFFSRNNYTLDRKAEYLEIWNQQVSQWREGKI